MDEITEEWQEKIRDGKCTYRTKVEFICQNPDVDHPNYMQTLGDHAQNRGCQKCGNLRSRNKRIRTEYSFIDEVVPSWKDKVINGECTSHTKVEFMCLKDKSHPNYMQTLTNHEFGCGCPLCWEENRAKTFARKDYPFMNEIVPEWQVKIRNGECNNETKVELICQNKQKHHPNYFQSLNAHLSQEQGCPICAEEQRKITRRKKYYPFMNEITLEYRQKIRSGQINCRDKVEFICKKHGNYFQSLNDHSNGCGCPVCSESKGEITIRNYLEDNNITYVPQKTFAECKFDKLLRFDFFVPKNNLVIEYQGEQHYEPVVIFGGEQSFKLQKKKDKLKREFCEARGIKLVEIPYWDLENIEDILDELEMTG